jgi:hypothetical protein
LRCSSKAIHYWRTRQPITEHPIRIYVQFALILPCRILSSMLLQFAAVCVNRLYPFSGSCEPSVASLKKPCFRTSLTLKRKNIQYYYLYSIWNILLVLFIHYCPLILIPCQEMFLEMTWRVVVYLIGRTYKFLKGVKDSRDKNILNTWNPVIPEFAFFNIRILWTVDSG